MPFYDYECDKCGVFEVRQNITEDAYKECPKCGSIGIQRLISAPAAFIYKGRQANTYNDCLYAKTWRDKNGNLHKVTTADGSYKSPTSTSAQYRSPEQIEIMKSKDNQIRQQKRQELSWKRALKRHQQKQR